MAYPNPGYDPHWKARHDAHAIERDRAQSEKDQLIAAGGMVSEAYEEAQARWERHHNECLSAIIAQYKTVQDYAAWRFRSSPPETGFQDVSVILPAVDFESLTTIEAADAAWERNYRVAKDTAADRRCSLPIGQPKGMLAFADATSPRLTRGWRQFRPRDLYPVGFPGTASVWALVTVDEQTDGWHICFAHRWGSPGISVTNAIERLATAVYREAFAIAAKQAPERIGFTTWIKQLLGQKTDRFAPDRFHFYEHTPPAPEGSLRENFSKVLLTFKDGEFSNPQWQHYSIIPRAIQSARLDLARDGTGSNRDILPRIKKDLILANRRTC